MDVKIYTTPTCGYCHQAKSFLDQLGVKYTEYDVSRDENAAREMISKTGQLGVPVITVGDQVVIGFDRVRLQALLDGNKIHFGLKIADAGKIAQKQGAIPILGALIGEVSPGSLGDKAGLKAGDIITEINSMRIGNADDVARVLGEIKSGSIVSILFLRGDENRKSEIIV